MGSWAPYSPCYVPIEPRYFPTRDSHTDMNELLMVALGHCVEVQRNVLVFTALPTCQVPRSCCRQRAEDTVALPSVCLSAPGRLL